MCLLFWLRMQSVVQLTTSHLFYIITFPFSLDQMLGFGEDLLKLLEMGNFYSCWHTCITTFFLYSNITIFSLTRNTSTCIHTMYMFVLWWKVRWCIEAHQCFTAVLHNIYMYIEVTICRLYMYTCSNIIIIDTDLKQLSY